MKPANVLPSLNATETDLVARFRPQLLALVLVLFCLAAHAISFWNGFVLNDHFNVPLLRDVAKTQWNQYWTELVTQAIIAPFAEPMLKASLAVDYQSGHLLPAVYHATNVFLHIAAVLSAFFLLRRLARYFNLARSGNSYSTTSTTGGAQLSDADRQAAAVNEVIPFVACLLFAVHPITSESVAYISGRSSILTFLFYTFALHGFLSGFLIPAVRAGILGYLFCYISLVLSTFTSCQAITIPETMIFLGLLLKTKGVSVKDWVGERSFEFLPALFAACALPCIFLLPASIQRLPLGNGLGLPLLTPAAYCATQAKELLTYYLRVFLIPVPLSFAPPFCLAQPAATPWLDPLALAGVALLLYTIYLIWAMRHKPFACFGLWLSVIGLLPQAIVVSNEFVNAQRFYLSCFGLCLFVASVGVEYIARKSKLEQSKAIAIEPGLVMPLALTALMLIGLANYRDRSFATDSALLRGALRSNFVDKDVPNQVDREGHVRALLSLMLTLNGGDNIERGLKEARRVLEVNRHLALAYLTLAREAVSIKDYDGAKYYAEQVIKLANEQKLSPEVFGLADEVMLIAQTELGQCSDLPKLRQMFEAAKTIDASNDKIYLALAKAYLAQYKPESGPMALVQLAHARRLDVNDLGLIAPIAEAHLAAGDPRGFESAYQAAGLLLKISSTTGSKLLLARACLETGRLAKCKNILEGEVGDNLERMDAEKAILLYGMYSQAGQKKEADRFLAQAKKFDPAIQTKIHLWLRVKPLTTIEQAREMAAERGESLVEKRKGAEPAPAKLPDVKTEPAPPSSH